MIAPNSIIDHRFSNSERVGTGNFGHAIDTVCANSYSHISMRPQAILFVPILMILDHHTIFVLRASMGSKFKGHGHINRLRFTTLIHALIKLSQAY